MSKLLRLAGSLVLLGLIAWKIDWPQVAQSFARLRLEWWLAAGVLLYPLSQVVSSLRWQWLARPLGFETTLGQCLRYYFIGMFWNLVLPTSVGGDVVRGWCLAGKTGRRGAAYLSVFADRLNGLCMLVALACLATCVAPVPPRVAWCVAVVGGTGVCGLLAWPLVRRVGRRWQRVEQLMQLADLYWKSPRLLLATSLLSIVVQVANILLVWVLGAALGLTVPLSYYFVLVPLVSLLTLLPVSLNGMGVREGGTILLLAPLGVAMGEAVTLSFLWFAVYTLISLAGGLLLFGRSAAEESSDVESVSGDPDQGRTRQSSAAA